VTDALLGDLTVLALAIFIGYEVISKVPVILHTPLMSGTNAIHGIVLVGGILVLGTADTVPAMILGAVAVFLGAVNVVGGFLVTDRMLLMFAKKRPSPTGTEAPPAPK
jgi:NAD(P) transhydrogenase subunit alpha